MHEMLPNQMNPEPSRDDRSHDIDLMGQKINYPRHTTACITACAFFLAVTVVVYLLLSRPKESTELFAFIAGIVQKDSKAIAQPSKLRVEFWTPSPRTWDSIIRAKGENGTNSDDEWQKNITETKLDEFGQRLIRSGFSTGWRRYEVVGRGEAITKTGYWWVMTCRQFDQQEFLDLYLKYWGEKDQVYLEITSSDASYLNQSK